MPNKKPHGGIRRSGQVFLECRLARRRSGIQNAASAGVSAGLGAPNPALSGLQGFITNVGQAEAFNVAFQLVQLATGQQKQFDWKQLVAAALQAETNAGIGKLASKIPNANLAKADNQLTGNFANDTINSAIKSYRFNAALVATDALASSSYEVKQK